MVNITHAAKAAVTAYAAAVQMGRNTSIPSSDVASAMASLYLPGFTSFTLGQITVLPNETSAATSIDNILKLYNASGLGTDIRLAKSRVEAVSDQAAFCFLTWKIFPRNHIKPGSSLMCTVSGVRRTEQTDSLEDGN